MERGGKTEEGRIEWRGERGEKTEEGRIERRGERIASFPGLHFSFILDRSLMADSLWFWILSVVLLSICLGWLWQCPALDMIG